MKNLQFFYYQITDDKWRPEIRESTTLTSIGNVFFSISFQKLYVFGGIGNKIFNSVCELNLSDWKWRKNTDSNCHIEGRFGHSANKHKNSIIIFGGEKQFNYHMKIRSCFNEFLQYNIEERDFTLLRPYGDLIESRRNHSSGIVSKFLFIFGGVNN